MNIFVLHEDPRICALSQCDKHIVKMLSENLQMMNHAHNPNSKKKYKNHPCSIWVRESIENYLWLYDLSYYLNIEYRYRYRKTKDHLAWIRIEELGIPDLQKKGRTQFILAMPQEYKSGCPIQSYRNYYIHEKGYFATWRGRKRPYWWKVI